jgi:hypothetical protein
MKFLIQTKFLVCRRTQGDARSLPKAMDKLVPLAAAMIAARDGMPGH